MSNGLYNRIRRTLGLLATIFIAISALELLGVIHSGMHHNGQLVTDPQEREHMSYILLGVGAVMAFVRLTLMRVKRE